MQCPGWREKGRRERKTRISMNEFRLKIRLNSSIGIRVFLLFSQFLSLEPSKDLKNMLEIIKIVNKLKYKFNSDIKWLNININLTI
jgi:hypothetical protein